MKEMLDSEDGRLLLLSMAEWLKTVRQRRIL